MIVDVEATRSVRQAEVGAAQTMLDRTEDRFGLKPGYLVADTAYGSAENFAWLVKHKQITPHIPVFDKSTRTDGTFSRSDFTCDADADRYICPAGKDLVRSAETSPRSRTGVDADGMRRYRASQKDCGVCELKPQCCPKNRRAQGSADLDEDARDVARALAGTPEFQGRVPPSEQGRDVVRPSQTHIGARTIAAAGAIWRQGRIPARGDRAKPAAARPIATCDAAHGGGGGIGRRNSGRQRDSTPAINFWKNASNRSADAHLPSFSTQSRKHRPMAEWESCGKQWALPSRRRHVFVGKKQPFVKRLDRRSQLRRRSRT